MLMPNAINDIPIKPFRVGAFSPRHIATMAVNRKLHELAIGTATDNSDFCNANTYSTLPIWFNRNGKMYCHRVTMNFSSSRSFVNLLFASIASIPTEPRLINGLVAPHRKPTTTNIVFSTTDIVKRQLPLSFGLIRFVFQFSICLLWTFTHNKKSHRAADICQIIATVTVNWTNKVNEKSSSAELKIFRVHIFTWIEFNKMILLLAISIVCFVTSFVHFLTKPVSC